ncbi:MAG: SOS response-associated peptidase [Actinobacteria bacterium]|nr:SOS response-associated peptidase [Actinomycetota bacterium]
MCGRVVTSSTPEELAEYLGADEIVATLDAPDHNVPPTRPLPLVWEETGGPGCARKLGTARWGLVPSWASDPSVGNRMFNARAETVAEKPSFRSAFKRRRCLVPIDGFYEWGPATPGSAGKKQPWFVHRADRDPLVLAGLWESRTVEGSGGLRTCTVITVDANEDLSAIHHRMPALLPPDGWSTWLDPDLDDRDLLEALLSPAPAGLLHRHPVDLRVGNPRNKGPGLMEPVEVDTAPGDTLFGAAVTP